MTSIQTKHSFTGRIWNIPGTTQYWPEKLEKRLRFCLLGVGGGGGGGEAECLADTQLYAYIS